MSDFCLRFCVFLDVRQEHYSIKPRFCYSLRLASPFTRNSFSLSLVLTFRQTVFPIFIVHEHIRLGWLRAVGAIFGAGRGRGFALEGKGALSSISSFHLLSFWGKKRGHHRGMRRGLNATFLKRDGLARLAVRRRTFTTFLSSSREGIFSTLCRNEVMTTNHKHLATVGLFRNNLLRQFFVH